MLDFLQLPRILALLIEEHALEALVTGGDLPDGEHRTEAFLRDQLPLSVDFTHLRGQQLQVQSEIPYTLLSRLRCKGWAFLDGRTFQVNCVFGH